MGQVLHTMKLQLPMVETVLNELRSLMNQPQDGTHRERLEKLCAGRSPGEAIANLEAFRQAVQAGRGLDATGLWVRVAPTLKVVNG